MTSESQRVRTASTDYARAVRRFKLGRAEQDQVTQAARELAAAHLARAMASARAAGLDDLDIAAVAVTGQLAASAQATAA